MLDSNPGPALMCKPALPMSSQAFHRSNSLQVFLDVWDGVRLLVRKADNPEESEPATLQELVESRCASLFTPFRPTWWLFNGHCRHGVVLSDFSKIDQVCIIDSVDSIFHYLTGYPVSGSLFRLHLLLILLKGLDFVPHNSYATDDATPIIVVQHGLTGGSHEPYVRAILAPACAPVKKGGLGYRAVVVNFRGSKRLPGSGVPITSPKFYTAGHTDDLRQALMYLSHKYPRAPLLGLGFSIGAKFIANIWLEGQQQFTVISHGTWLYPQLGNHTYHVTWTPLKNDIECGKFLWKTCILRGMGSNVLALIRHHYKPLALDNPDHPVAAAIHRFWREKPDHADFDDTFTRFVGYPSSISQLNASDDPVIRYAPFHDGDNKYTVTAVTRKGVTSDGFTKNRQRWTTKPVLEWLQLVGRDLQHSQPAWSLYTTVRDLASKGKLEIESQSAVSTRVVVLNYVLLNDQHIRFHGDRVYAMLRSRHLLIMPEELHCHGKTVRVNFNSDASRRPWLLLTNWMLGLVFPHFPPTIVLFPLRGIWQAHPYTHRLMNTLKDMVSHAPTAVFNFLAAGGLILAFGNIAADGAMPQYPSKQDLVQHDSSRGWAAISGLCFIIDSYRFDPCYDQVVQNFADIQRDPIICTAIVWTISRPDICDYLRHWVGNSALYGSLKRSDLRLSSLVRILVFTHDGLNWIGSRCFCSFPSDGTNSYAIWSALLPIRTYSQTQVPFLCGIAFGTQKYKDIMHGWMFWKLSYPPNRVNGANLTLASGREVDEAWASEPPEKQSSSLRYVMNFTPSIVEALVEAGWRKRRLTIS
ncbi:hypothetical protein B0H10DRAFT_1946628 [Mycena sp. CBHHK59/15]|nr:hypothetical protein B0H10DRAFT_1946628 [Mycena sp. CBHHK59/15]